MKGKYGALIQWAAIGAALGIGVCWSAGGGATDVWAETGLATAPLDWLPYVAGTSAVMVLASIVFVRHVAKWVALGVILGTAAWVVLTMMWGASIHTSGSPPVWWHFAAGGLLAPMVIVGCRTLRRLAPNGHYAAASQRNQAAGCCVGEYTGATEVEAQGDRTQGRYTPIQYGSSKV